MYENEIKALKRAGRFRERKLYKNLQDFASNDYLGLAEDKEILEKTISYLRKNDTYGSKASQLVNGYHPIFEKFENYLCKINGFEKGMVVGSGFLANLALFEALARKGDTILMDEEYHASGIVGTKLSDGDTIFFKHNDIKDLEEKLQNVNSKRIFIAVEGIYSMGGDLMKKEIFDIAKKYSAVLIVDEAHSSGVIGENLSGIFSHYGIKPTKNHIKMGTLGKAYGSYGAYILASNEVISFLENRAKSVIYATAPSIYDVAYGYYSAKKIQKNVEKYKEKIGKVQKEVEEVFGVKCESLILPIKVGTSKEAVAIQRILNKEGFLVGAIRKPTVKEPILRVILRIEQDKLKKLLKKIKYSIN